MLKKNVDFTLVGKSYLSFILGLELLDEKKNVLVLDDQRIQYGETFLNQLSALDVEFIKFLGKKNKIKVLEEIDQNIKILSYNFFYNNSRIRLEKDPHSNFIEILRKIPGFHRDQIHTYIKKLDQLDFNADYFHYIKLIAARASEFQSPSSFNYLALSEGAPEILIQFANDFYQALHNNYDLLVFLYMSSSISHSSLRREFSKFEVLHLICSLLSPRYELKNVDFEKKLENIFRLRGGQFKSTYIRQWLFHKKKPWSVELASYEGIIHPKKLVFMGGLPENFPIKVEPERNIYSPLIYNLPCKEAEYEQFKNSFFLFGNTSWIGTRFPMVKFLVKKNEIIILVLVKRQKGSKLNFFRAESTERIKFLFHKYFYFYNFDLSKLQGPTLGHEIYLNEHFRDNRSVTDKNETAMHPKVDLFNFSNPTDKEKMKDAFYVGPLKNKPLGLFSTILEIKSPHEFL